MRVCVWTAIAGAWGLIGCSPATSWEVEGGYAGAEADGSAGARHLAQQAAGAAGEFASGGSAASVAGDAGSPDEPGGSGGSATGGNGPIIEETGGSAGKPAAPECTGSFTQICPDIPGCVDLSKRECVNGKWSECKCLDECAPGAGRECTVVDDIGGVQVCGAKAHWSECYPPPPDNTAPAHVLCHMPKGDHVGPEQMPGGDMYSADYPICVLACFFDESDNYIEYKMRFKELPANAVRCAQQADGCWRCP